eukprot:GHVH01007375.1.p1 GENE.GHVH01007375.1~~GHVH01007375.1.p1  ORF type:complete len:488 (+),score=93.12 GHVH01007375.1:928-2391(+)
MYDKFYPSARGFQNSCKHLLNAIEVCLRESYSIWLWSVTEKQKIIELTIANHKAHTEFVHATELSFIEQLTDGRLSETLVVPPSFNLPKIKDSINVSHRLMMTRLELFEAQGSAIDRLRASIVQPWPDTKHLNVASTIVLNKTPGLWSKQTPPFQIDVDQPMLIQSTWDRYIHIFRSHEDLVPVKSIYLLEMKPVVKSGKGSEEEVIELQPLASLQGSLINMFKKTNSNSTPIAFSFPTEDEAKLWKKLIRYGSLEIDIVFLTHGKVVSGEAVAVHHDSTALEAEPEPATACGSDDKTISNFPIVVMESHEDEFHEHSADHPLEEEVETVKGKSEEASIPEVETVKGKSEEASIPEVETVKGKSDEPEAPAVEESDQNDVDQNDVEPLIVHHVCVDEATTDDEEDQTKREDVVSTPDSAPLRGPPSIADVKIIEIHDEEETAAGGSSDLDSPRLTTVDASFVGTGGAEVASINEAEVVSCFHVDEDQ